MLAGINRPAQCPVGALSQGKVRLFPCGWFRFAGIHCIWNAKLNNARGAANDLHPAAWTEARLFKPTAHEPDFWFDAVCGKISFLLDFQGAV